MRLDVFDPLRSFVKDIFQTYRAQLREVAVSTCLQLVFWHRDEESSRMMVQQKDQVQGTFQRFFMEAGHETGKFDVEVLRDAGTTLTDRSPWQQTRENVCEEFLFNDPSGQKGRYVLLVVNV